MNRSAPAFIPFFLDMHQAGFIRGMSAHGIKGIALLPGIAATIDEIDKGLRTASGPQLIAISRHEGKWVGGIWCGIGW